MRLRILVILFLCLLTSVYGQKEAANWYFGNFAGVNFNRKVPVAQKGELETREGCAAISDRRGNLLFYTDGSTIWNRIDSVMPNGQDLYGSHSSTQSAIIIPKPGDPNIYYVFTVNNAEKLTDSDIKRGLNYSVVDMSLHNGLGDVVQGAKNRHLITYDQGSAEQSDWKCNEKIAATIHDDENSYWVLTHFVDTFYAFKIDDKGVEHNPVKTKVQDRVNIVDVYIPPTLHANLSAVGYLKISPNSEKVAIVHSRTAEPRSTGRVYLYDFDNGTGQLSSKGNLIMSGSYPYGVEFSPKSNKLYVTTSGYRPTKEGIDFSGSSILQFDLSQPDIGGTRTEIHHSPRLGGGALQLAINGKIYRSKFDVQANTGLSSLGAIEKPDRLGDASMYNDDALDLMSGSTSEQGLPPFISQLFLLSFDYEFNCEGEETQFFITTDDVFDSVTWDFDDGPDSNSTEEAPLYRFSEPGIYEVTLTAHLEGIPDRVYTKTVEIFERVGVPQSPYELIECDVDLYREDGLTTFNLSFADGPISLDKEESTDVYYYKDLHTLVNDTLNENSLPMLYTNTERDEKLYAKVVLKIADCYSVGEVILKTEPTDEFTAEDLYGCDLGEGKAEFDLNAHKSGIFSQHNLPPGTEITFHERRNLATLGLEPLGPTFHSRPKKIYFRISNEKVCLGIGEVELSIKDLPFLKSDEIINICQQDLPLIIDAGVGEADRNNYSYEWMKGGKTHDLEVHGYGEYYVTVTDKLTLCSNVRSIQVKPIPIPQVEKIEILEEFSSTSARVVVMNEGEFEFSLNDENGQYQDNPVFYNLEGGTHSVFIRDINNCTSVERKFFIFGFPRFFTPNNDGHNDVWEVKGLNPLEFTYTEIKIYNRFGKLLASIPADSYWDGIYNGKLLPADDYWFKVGVTDQNNQTIYYTKHFSLVRE